jgi:1-phosphofructokinase family hexose kinase
MILSAGLTPAWQQIIVFENITPGEVNRAEQVHRCASGKAINAALAVAHLGEKENSRLLTPSGGLHGQAMEDDLRRLAIPFRPIGTESATRVCTTLIDRRKREITELVENGPPWRREELDAFRHAFTEEAAAAKVAILSGSLPDGCDVQYYDELLAAVPCPVVCDIRGPALLQALPRRPLLVKPNFQELQQTLGSELSDEKELLAGMRSVNEQGAQWTMVTRGRESVFLTSEEEAYRLEPISVPEEEVVNPIGCGDAVTGGFAWAMSEGATAEEAARIGLAAAAENIRRLLPCRLDRSAVLSRAEKVRFTRV